MNNRKHLALIAVLLCLLLVMVAAVQVVAAGDPAPASVVGVRTVTLRDVGYIADAETRSERTVYYGIADVFYSVNVTSYATGTLNLVIPYLEWSPDNVIWYSRALPTVTTATLATQYMTRTALYGEYFRVRFDMLATQLAPISPALTVTLMYTPVVKVTLKNLE